MDVNIILNKVKAGELDIKEAEEAASVGYGARYVAAQINRLAVRKF